MVLQSAQCNLCGFKETKNGTIQLRSAMDQHSMKDHPEEYRAKRTKDYEISLAIRELKKSAIQLWRNL